MALAIRKQHHYLVLSGLLFTFFWTWSSVFSLISLWLHQKIGLTGAETGLIFSIIALTALCAAIVWLYSG